LTPDERANLVAYIDGELPDAISRVLSTKLTQSATARQEVEILKKTWELLGHLPMPQADPQLCERTLVEIQRLGVRNPALGSSARLVSSWAALMLAYAALGGLGLGLGYAATRWLWPDPAARLARDLSLAEHLEEYLEVGSFEFLKDLAEAPEFNPAPR
jgi:anti-sigma factor RsiW